MIFSDKTIPASTKEKVRALCERGRLPQSVMLTGGSVRLREKCALELAAAALCRSPERGQPCLKCAACSKVKAGAHPDLVRVMPEKDKKTVPIKAVREQVLEPLWVAPNEAGVKVYLFYAAETLSDVIQNAILKTIEEPPPFAMFVFLCEQREKMLTTVISRVTELHLGDVLAAERPKQEEEEIRIAAGVINALCTGSEYELMLSVSPMVKNRGLMKKIAGKIIVAVRDALAQGACDALSGCEREVLLLHMTYSPPALFEIKEAMEKISAWAQANANENLLISEFSSMLSKIRK